MPEKRPILYPTGFVTSTAIGFADNTGNLSFVTTDSPLPVLTARAGNPATLAGQATATALIGPFLPLRGEPIHLQLSGTWTGTVTLQRSTDGGATRQALTLGGQAWARFTTNVNEPVWEEGEAGATFYLDVVLASGAVNYLVSQ